MCESHLVLLILTATLLGNYYYSLFAEGETEALPGCKVVAVPCICDVPYREGRIQWQRLKEAVRLCGENPVSGPTTRLWETHLMRQCLSSVNG